MDLRFRRGIIPYVIAIFLLLCVAVFVYLYNFWPNHKHVSYPFGGLQKPVFYKGTMLSQSAKGEKEGLKLPFGVFKEIIDPAIFYEESSQSVIVTTKDKVIRLKTSQLTGLVNEKPFTLRFAVEKDGETIEVPVDPLKEFYRLEVIESPETGSVILHKAGDVIEWGKAAEDAKHPKRTRPLRTKPSIKAAVYADIKQADRVMIWGEENGWYRAQLLNGVIGYVKKEDIVLDNPETVPVPEQKSEFVPWRPAGGKINLTWQQVYNKNPDTGKIGPMPGLNVISPQWFALADGEGNIKNMADASFVKWAHTQNNQLWALFSNGFDPKLTSEALSTYDKRIKIIKQLLSYAQMYHIEGINIDFENVYLKDKANMVQFVREMTPFLHEQGLAVSIDVTVKGGSETYSKFMDRKAIGEVVDYMIVMAYDEHWASSPKAGSVASLPWVEKGIAQIMQEDQVPSSKLVLGIPFYTRIWTEQTKDGKPSVSSKVLSMDAVQKLIQDKKLTPVFDAETGQNFVQFTESDKTNKIWIEDEVSISSRMDLVRKYDLAGAASWSRGFEKPGIWPLIKEALEKKP